MRIVPKDPRIKLPKLLASAEGQPCLLHVPDVCRGRTDTVVACHSNYSKHGKAKGKKSHDFMIAFGCMECHTWLDGPIPAQWTEAERQDLFERAHIDTLKHCFREGILKC